MAFPKLHKNIQVRILTSFLSRLLGSMIYPFMAIYFSGHFGSKFAGILLLIGVWIQIVVGFYGGYLADKIGRKKIMSIGIIIQLITYIFMALANSPILDSAWLTLIMFTLNGASGGLVYPATSALLIDSSTLENRTFMFSIQYWTSNVSFMIGSLLGGFYFEHHRFELFSGLAVCTAFTLILTIYIMTDSYVPKKVIGKVHVIKDIVHSYKVVVKDKAFMYFIFATVFLWSMESHSANFIAVRLAKEFKTEVVQFFHFTSFEVTGYKIIGFLNTENATLVVLFGIFISSWIRNKGMKNILYISILMYFIGYIVLSYSNSLWLIFIVGLILTFGEMFSTPIAHTYESEMMDESARGSYSAIGSFGGNLTQLAGAIGLTLYGWIGGYGMAAVIALCGVCSFYFFHISLKIHSEKMLKQKAMALE
ncbi:MAG: emrB [Bacillales bacterium]|jgi:DHA1 family multidrug resistance protein B-like MFS transporter|nr:emrB [Bacillales bacterium]